MREWFLLAGGRGQKHTSVQGGNNEERDGTNVIVRDKNFYEGFRVSYNGLRGR